MINSWIWRHNVCIHMMNWKKIMLKNELERPNLVAIAAYLFFAIAGTVKKDSKVPSTNHLILSWRDIRLRLTIVLMSNSAQNRNIWYSSTETRIKLRKFRAIWPILQSKFPPRHHFLYLRGLNPMWFLRLRLGMKEKGKSKLNWYSILHHRFWQFWSVLAPELFVNYSLIIWVSSLCCESIRAKDNFDVQPISSDTLWYCEKSRWKPVPSDLQHTKWSLSEDKSTGENKCTAIPVWRSKRSELLIPATL